ncbi:IS110 family transposase [Marinifilum sp. N1E240]|uniref:IS110 family transposase n=1 Tax=Marinifilum sp. N1E240 TaxID=2608082 RepID=UPI00128AF409|nr:IS110 family transposase [Marinifilum sp. N1E240]MPQ49306.1 IS110 family transposase [Marinifilum sp. N1E240]
MQVYGIDLSMEKFDVSYINNEGIEMHKQVKNSLNSISKFLSKVPDAAILCAENTGSYGDLLVFLCNQQNLKIALVPGYNIKHSLGLVKGKTDKVDASRIREYAERFNDKLVFKEYDSEEMFELKSLHALRSQLIKARKLLLAGGHSRTKTPMQSIAVKHHMDMALISLNKQIKEVDFEMETIIRSHEELNDNFVLATSVLGIGPVIGIDLIIKTGNFKTIDTARKASSYAGVCPFPNKSGKMVGKSKTSPFADRKLKSLLYMGAKSALKSSKEYKLYYQKKKLEGKAYFLIMNNISNKMLRTVYSVVKSKVPYSRDYICLDPREKNINNSSSKNVA